MEHWTDKSITKEQFLSDNGILFGSIMDSCRITEEGIEITKFQDSQDGIQAWIAITNYYDKSGNKRI